MTGRGGGSPRGNLPAQLLPFVGRRKELASLSKLLRDQRLVTLLGPAGIGKTRLALCLAEEVRRQFPDGVWLVELSEATDADLLAAAMARAVEIAESKGDDPLATLKAALGPRQALLVVDNCELVVDQLAGVLDELLRACPSLKVLATSRRRIGVQGELVWRVPSLELPGPRQAYSPLELAGLDAVALFVDRAGFRNPDFGITEANVDDVACLVRHLDGLPLAIELAATWTDTLSPAELLRHLTQRFHLLVTRERIVNPRHSSLLAAIDSSYVELDPPCQALFRQLGVFAGGWNLDSMVAVCELEPAASLGSLRQLIDHSFVTVVAAPGGPTRYRLLEALRDYALAKLRDSGQDQAAFGRFERHFRDVADVAVARMTTTEGPRWLQVLDVELDNLRAALAMEQTEPELRLRVAVALVPYWHFRGLLTEGRLRLRAALDAALAPTPAVVAGLNGLSWLCWAQGDLAIAGRHGRQAFRVARRIGDRAGSAWALLRMAQASFDAARMAEAAARAELARAIGAELGNDRLVAAGVLHLGQVAFVEGRVEEADLLLRRSIDLFSRNGQVDQEAIALLVLGRLRLRQGMLQDAEGALIRSLATLREFQLPRHTVPLVESLAAVAAERGDVARGARLAGGGAGLLERMGARPPATAPMRNAIVARLQSLMTGPESDHAFAEGRAMDLAELTAYALGEPPPARLEPDSHDESPSASLTSRQMEVARLVAQGSTNKEIAARLFISERTAEGHVEQICIKLNFNSRVQIAAWVIRQEQRQEPR